MPNIDEIFRAGLADHEMAPDASGWDKLSKQLTSKEGKVVLPWYYNPKKALLGALVISLMSFTVGYFIAQAYISEQSSQNLVVDQSENKIEEPVIKEPLFVNPQNRQFAINLLKESENDQTIGSKYDLPKNTGSWVANGVNEDLHKDALIEEGLNDEFETFKTPLVDINNLKSDKGETKEIISVVPTFEANEALGRRFINQISFSRTSFAQANGSYSQLVELDFTDQWTSEEALLFSTNYELKYSRKLSRNFSLIAGFGVDVNTLSISGNQVIYDKDDTGQNLENRDELSNLDYTRNYNSSIAYAPVGLRFSGKYLKLGYSIEGGALVQKLLSEQRSFSFSDESFLPLANTWANTVFDETPRLGFYSSIGFDAYLTNNFGLSFDAIIRKRMQPLVSAQGFDDDLYQKGFNLGLFYNF